jgi:type IV secretion system protein TrbL
MRRYGLTIPLILLLVLVVAAPVAHAQAVDVHSVVDTLLGKYKSAGQTWATTIQNAATNLFWLLATISLAWTCISMGIKQADLVEIVAELCRFIMVTGLFFWLLTNGPTFANDIVRSLWQVGGDATGTGQSIYPGDLITLGMQVFQQEMTQINILLPAATGIPAAIAVVILIVCALIAVNMILLLCAAWIVLYAGLIFLGFGGCRWTSDMAINYYRTVLGVGVSLMTMQLVIGIGIQFLQQLVASTGSSPDVGQVAIIMCATIILAVISHRLPQMVAGMVVGGGHNGAIGGVGMMTLLAAGMTGAGVAARMSGHPAAVAAAAGTAEGAKMLQDRIAAAEAAMGAQESQGSISSDTSGSGGGATAASSPAGGSTSGGSAAANPIRWPGRRSRPGGTKSSLAIAPDGKPTAGGRAGEQTDGGVQEAESPQTRPMSADEARGFGPDGNGGSDDQPYTPSSGDKVT